MMRTCCFILAQNFKVVFRVATKPLRGYYPILYSTRGSGRFSKALHTLLEARVGSKALDTLLQTRVGFSKALHFLLYWVGYRFRKLYSHGTLCTTLDTLLCPRVGLVFPAILYYTVG